MTTRITTNGIMDLHNWLHGGEASLVTMRSTTARVLDSAARSLGTTRAAAHADLWPRALRLASKWQERGLRAKPARQQSWRMVIRWSGGGTRLTEPLPNKDRAHAHARSTFVHLLAGAALWLQTFGEPRDTFAREGLTIGLAIMDALDSHGCGSYISDDGGRAPEHICVSGSADEDVDVLVGTADHEHISVPLGEKARLIAERADAEGSTFYDEKAVITLECINHFAVQVVRATRIL